MATLEERVQTLEQEIAARKQAEEMLTIAVRALVSKPTGCAPMCVLVKCTGGGEP